MPANVTQIDELVLSPAVRQEKRGQPCNDDENQYHPTWCDRREFDTAVSQGEEIEDQKSFIQIFASDIKTRRSL